MTQETLSTLPIIESRITSLEMTANPHLQPVPMGEFAVRREEHLTVAAYLEIYRAVGRDYIWNYRPGQSEQEIERIIHSPDTWLYLLRRESDVIGMAELDAADPHDVELVHFGLIPQFLHQGIGKKFLHHIIHLAWNSGAERMWLSTCGMDHPKTIGFYEKVGFKVYETKMGEFRDYRFSGFYSLTDAPQIPFGTRGDVTN